jgi:PIN domain nuclease of toxin-antitoxin system
VGAVTASAVLLDTHAAIWALSDPDRLGPAARETIERRSIALWVSAASVWELSTKHRLGRLPDGEALLAGWDRHLTRLGARELPIGFAHARLAGALEWEHRDPFDRMLVAQSRIESLPLVTKDAAIADGAGVHVVW